MTFLLKKMSASFSDVFAFLISIVQAIIFIIAGPGALFCGPAVDKAVVLLQAVLAAGYLEAIGVLQALSYSNVETAFEAVIFLITGTITVALATLKSPNTRKVMNGMLTGYLISEPILAFVSDVLYSTVAECSSVGEKTIQFPKGKPTGCESETLFFVCYYFYKAMTWMVTLKCGKLASSKNKPEYSELFLISACVLSGSSAFVKSGIDLLYSLVRVVSVEWAEVPTIFFVGFI